MAALEKITVEVSESMLRYAQEHTGKGVSKTVREGLARLAHAQASDRLLSLSGKIKFDESWETLRGKDDED
jgi:hypothetical protein